MHHASFAAAGWTRILQTSCSAAARARQIKLHRSGHLCYGSAAVAFRTDSHVRACRSRAVARLACLLPRDIQLHLCAADRLPEIDVQPVLEVRTALRLSRGLARPPPAEETAEYV